MRLINAESPQNGIYVSDLVIEEMKKIPTVDIDRPTRSQFKRMAVQLGYEKVVHCKDCRLGEPDMYLNGGEDKVWCNYYDCPKTAAGFCEKGKRKNDFVDDNKIGERRTDENEPLGT
jgi:hypothetical protein